MPGELRGRMCICHCHGVPIDWPWRVPRARWPGTQTFPINTAVLHNAALAVQIFGNNDEAAAAVVLLMDALREYDAGSSRSIPRLKDQWESRRQSELYPPPDGGYPGGAGGPSPNRERYPGGGGSSRYEPYPRRGASSSTGGPDPYGAPASHTGPPMQGGDAMTPSPMVVMPGGMQVPNIPGQMPTVLIQQADGTLVQAQVVTQAGGQYAVQPATSAQASVQVMKNSYGISQPLAMPTAAATGGAPAPQTAMPGAPPSQVLVSGPNGMMYATTAPGAPPVAPGGPPGGSDRGSTAGGSAPGGPYGSGMQGSQYQVQPAGAPVAGGSQQVADPMAYNKLAGYGQQGASLSTFRAGHVSFNALTVCSGHCDQLWRWLPQLCRCSDQESVVQLRRARSPWESVLCPQPWFLLFLSRVLIAGAVKAPPGAQYAAQVPPPQHQPQQHQQQMYGGQPAAGYTQSVQYGGGPMASGPAQYPAQYSAASGGQYK